MTRPAIGFAVLLGVLLAPFGNAFAEDSGATRSLTWRGRPLPEVRSFLITESSMSLSTYDPVEGAELVAFSGTDLGWMRNVSERWAIGGRLYAQWGSRHGRLGARGRVRYWFTRWLSSDVTLGAIVANTQDGDRPRYRPPGVITSATINLRDQLGVFLEHEGARYEGEQRLGEGHYVPDRRYRHTTRRIGLKLGSVPGSVALVLFGIVGIGELSSF